MMNRKHSLIFFFILIVLGSVLSGQEKLDDFPVLTGPYLGQTLPGLTPKIFAPGIISTNKHEGCSGFTQDGSFYFFSRYRAGILVMENKSGSWSRPYEAPFSDKNQDGDFCVSPDGKKIYFASGRPLESGKQPTRNHNIWVVKRTDTGWSQPHPLDYPINTDWHESYPSVTEDGTLYFFKRDKDPEGQSDIFRSRLEDGTYKRIEKLGGSINTEYNDLDAFISPDESYLIFCSDRPGGYGNADFYVSFRKNDGSWTDPINMGNKINSPSAEWIPYVSPEGKYFFFTSNESGNREIYWVDAKIIEKLKPDEFN